MVRVDVVHRMAILERAPYVAEQLDQVVRVRRIVLVEWMFDGLRWVERTKVV